MNDNSKHIAILNASSATAPSAKDALDTALIYASFEQPISLFYQGEGVRQLVNNQDLTTIHVKDFLKTMSAFSFYDIENIYVCENSLKSRLLATNFHIENVQVLTPNEFANKLHEHQVILRF